MLSLIDLREGLPEQDLRSVLPRPGVPGDGRDAGGADDGVAGVDEAVRSLLKEVRARGDAAVRELTARFDGVEVTTLRVDPDVVAGAPRRVPEDVRDALVEAHRRIEAYHAIERSPAAYFEDGGISVRELIRPVARAGCYAPGGRARYPSSVLMTAVPARVAGVDEIVLCVPPGPDGSIDDASLAAAALAGVDEVYRIGGVQAIGAMAFGTESVGAVDVIVGPGNRFVAEAKRQVAGFVGVPSAFTGPSEVVVVADGAADPQLVAADLLVQAEHGPDGMAWLVTWEPAQAEAVAAAVALLVATSVRRGEIEATLATGSRTVLVGSPSDAMAVANAIAPEHLELHVEEPAALVPQVRNAGAVFCGPFAPATLGDYAAGPNHVLPTGGSARFAQALRVDDFVKRIHVVEAGREGLAGLAKTVETLAEVEGLDAHAASIRLRRESLGAL